MLESVFLGNLLGLVVVGKNRQRLSAIEDFDLLTDKFNLTRRKATVGLAVPHSDSAADRHDIFPAKRGREFHCGSGRVFSIKDDLGHPVPVAEVDEHKSLSLIAIGVDPSVEGVLLTSVVGS